MCLYQRIIVSARSIDGIRQVVSRVLSLPGSRGEDGRETPGYSITMLWADNDCGPDLRNTRAKNLGFFGVNPIW